MKFALLGVDQETLELARVLALRGEHEITAIYQPGAFAGQIRTSFPEAQIGDDWEDLLLAGAADCVVVGRGAASEEERGEQLKRLVQAAVPQVVIHPACEYILGYEIEMIRKDLRSVIVPYFPGSRGQIWANLRQLALEGADGLGRVEQLVVERPLAVRTPQAVLAQLARDATVVRYVLGPIRAVSAVGSLDEKNSVLSVQLASGDGRLARWSVEPANEHEPARYIAVGSEGKRSVGGDKGDGDDQGVDALIAELSSALSGQDSLAFSWLDACRAQEVAATAPRCLARGKTIELHNQEHTEDAAFKGTMAVGGCLILLLLLAFTVSWSVIEGLNLGLEWFWAWRNLPLLLLVPIAFFLFLQVLGWIARRDRATERPPGDN
jgi:hypothetical protein